MKNIRNPFREQYRVTSPFGSRTLNGVQTYHAGIDLFCDNPVVVATESGKVITSRIVADKSNKTWEWGNYICIQTDDGKQLYYCHLMQRSVNAGEYIKAGAGIGLMGNTGHSFGAHLHFEVRKNNVPVNPAEYLGIENKIGTAIPLKQGETVAEEKRYDRIEDIPDWARKEIQWMIDKQYLKGSNGKLNLSHDMLRMTVIMSRALQNLFKE